MTNEQLKMIAISSAVAAAASVIASAIVASLISKASEKRAQENAQASVWTILGEQQAPVSGYGSQYLKPRATRRQPSRPSLGVAPVAVLKAPRGCR